MANSIKHTPKTLLDANFEKDVKGYNSLQVDQLLDEVISDYEQFGKALKENAEINAKHLTEIENLKKTVHDLEIVVAKYKKQLDDLPKGEGLNQDNYQLLKKVYAYEKVLYKKGIDLKKALSDPDNC